MGLTMNEKLAATRQLVFEHKLAAGKNEGGRPSCRPTREKALRKALVYARQDSNGNAQHCPRPPEPQAMRGIAREFRRPGTAELLSGAGDSPPCCDAENR
jgi:hypothetical protein